MTLQPKGEGSDRYMQREIVYEKRGLVPYRPKMKPREFSPTKSKGLWRETHGDGPKHIPKGF